MCATKLTYNPRQSVYTYFVRLGAKGFCERLTHPKHPPSIGCIQDANQKGSIEQGNQRDSEKAFLRRK